jgi:hypothetical protein
MFNKHVLDYYLYKDVCHPKHLYWFRFWLKEVMGDK